MATYTTPTALPAVCVPPPCVYCGKPSRANDNLCESCFRASANLCHYCGEPLPEGGIAATCWPCATLAAEQSPPYDLPF
jgi:predicted amidophosphoribosyltransferase